MSGIANSVVDSTLLRSGVGKQPLVGVLMLNTRFVRFPRDIGHPESLPFASIQRRIDSASVSRVVTSSALPEDVLNAFVSAGHSLIDEGATLITTSCGFLHSVQAELEQALTVPVVTSSLVALRQLQSTHTAAVGILTFDERALDGRHLGQGMPDAAPPVIVGMDPDSHFADVIHERVAADSDKLLQDVADAARKLARHQPSAVLLECTNLAPWRHVVELVCGVPVVDLIDVLEWRLVDQP